MRNTIITWGDKISKIQRGADYKLKHSRPMICVVCGASMAGYVKHQKFCSRNCQYKHNYKDLEPLIKKAKTLSSPIVFGRGRKEFFEKLISESIGKHCRYCEGMLNLENMSLDHIIPFGSNKFRLNKVVQKQLNVPENLQIICKKCNGMKGNLSHEKFVKLLDFLNKDPTLKDYITKKLAQGSLIWNYRRIYN